MGKEKSLYALGEEYEKDIATLTAQIEACKAKMQTAVGIEHMEYGRRLAQLYEMRRDVKINADTLKHYYDNRMEKRAFRKSGYFNWNKE